MNMTDELERLHKLHQSGVLNETEFKQAKANLLMGPSPSVGAPGYTPPPGYVPPHGVRPIPMPLDPVRMEQETRQWAFFLHLSSLAGLIVPIAGWVAPIVIWQVRKNDLPGLDPHGKVAVNWMISELIYVIVGAVLCLVLIGIPLLIGLLIIGIVFPIMGAVKANNGEVWRYPLSIEFLK
jgi:uncharacterized Tic20 family protein